ncbi:MAG: hypothetical protein NZ954_02135 [Thermofilaceae archaeon]|nr:hypothetical protein [Thermofilaceae archaeon]MCX8180907.1 hypothetical protein [Thermofilaceae archaeon]MDW8003472.1 hypothetical protein [Thermofilaceae archaeon]
MNRFHLLAVLISTYAVLTYAQPSYWIALNYKVTFSSDGSALVEAMLHPFSLDGNSLFGDARVERDLNASVRGIANYTLLMFSDNLKLLSYSLLSYEKRLHETVMCDVANTGVMSSFKGAYVLSTLVYLNTSNYVRKLNATLYEVKVRDSFTSMDVRSWIDVIHFCFKNVRLREFRWEPPFARGPKSAEDGCMLWENYNEQEAPDFYVFILEAPSFEYVGEPPEISAVISNIEYGYNRFTVTVKNTGLTSGYAYVRVVSNSSEQARKIYLSARASREVTFPNIAGEVFIIELYSGSELLDNRTFTTYHGDVVEPSDTVKPPDTSDKQQSTMPSVTVILIVTFIAVILIILVLTVFFKKSRQQSQENYSTDVYLK